jgi:hypothetical protein
MSASLNIKKVDPYTLTPQEREANRQIALAYAAANLKACAEELVDWSKTGVLAEGHMRHLAALFANAGGDNGGLPVAKAEVLHLCMLKMLELMK